MRHPRDPRPALRRDLAALADRLSADELEVLLLLAARAWAGQSRYGCLAVHRDPRDFAAEALEELMDACFYLGAALLRRRGRHRTVPCAGHRRGVPHA